jgi:hypothetical protein
LRLLLLLLFSLSLVSKSFEPQSSNSRSFCWPLTILR